MLSTNLYKQRDVKTAVIPKNEGNKAHKLFSSIGVHIKKYSSFPNWCRKKVSLTKGILRTRIYQSIIHINNSKNIYDAFTFFSKKNQMHILMSTDITGNNITEVIQMQKSQ